MSDFEQQNLFDDSSGSTRDELEANAFSARRTPKRGAKSCAFCAIVRGELAARVVLDEPDFVAFLDARPVFPGHVLVVPRLHIQTYERLPIGLATSLVRTVQRIQVAVERSTAADGSLHIVNNVISQSVPHLHYHVIPRKRKDGLRFWLGPRVAYATDDEADEMARRIRAALDDMAARETE